ncbi:MAG: hypothetical protein LiPW39_333 [Parcubacteria group bacterium LiPW_39]|nr:MAG: hypothetical protein LiPW39_333 [Parcubacteria group bacterium LiPW_39]
MSKKIFLKIFILTLLMTMSCFWPAQSPRAQDVSGNFILAWSSGSYVPANYQGKALPTRLSRVKVVVLPTKKLSQDPEKLYYRWLLDNEIAGKSGGQGKSAFNFWVTRWGGDYHEIESQIVDENENIIARNFISIPVVEAQTLLWRPNSDYAAQDKITAKTGQQLNLFAAPLFFHIKNLAELNFEWNFDGQTLTSADQKDLNRFTLKIPAGTLTESLLRQLKLYVTHKVDQFQQTLNDLTIEIK